MIKQRIYYRQEVLRQAVRRCWYSFRGLELVSVLRVATDVRSASGTDVGMVAGTNVGMTVGTDEVEADMNMEVGTDLETGVE